MCRILFAGKWIVSQLNVLYNFLHILKITGLLQKYFNNSLNIIGFFYVGILFIWYRREFLELLDLPEAEAHRPAEGW